MRLVCLLLVAMCGIAHADTAWSEYGAGVARRPAAQLVQNACDVDVTLRGAIAQIERRETLTNGSGAPLAATTDFRLPAGAQLVGLEVKLGNRKAEAALPVKAGFKREWVTDRTVLGPDLAVLQPTVDDGSGQWYQLTLAPIEPEQEATVTLRSVQVAEIRGGALRVELEGREDGRCHGSVRAVPGPGTKVARIRAGAQETQRTFTLTDKPLTIAVDLAFARPEPLVWTQSEELGDGMTAQAITILTPPARATAARRVLFVIDGSRSMELIGRHRVKQLVHALAGALTKGTELDAIVFDRTAARVLGAWHAIDATQLAAIESAIDKHTAGNGSDAAAAFTLARQAINDTRGDTQIVLVTDGSFGDQPDTTLAHALGNLGVRLHAIVLTRGRMRVADIDPLRAAINWIGGSYTELDVEQLDTELTSLDDWLRPAWLELQLDAELARNNGWGSSEPIHPPPSELRAGAGLVLTTVVKHPRKPTLSAHRDKPVKVAARAALTAPVAELALARAVEERAVEPEILERLRIRHPAVDEDHPFVVLAIEGKAARSRREATAGGAPFTHMASIGEPGSVPPTAQVAAKQAAGGGSAIDRDAIRLLLLTQLQPAAFACYQKALPLAPKLAGTAQFQLEIGRGETMHASVTGLGNATFDACLLDAAYLVTPSLPNPDYNVDDRTLVNYPLTFSVREQKPFIIAGDADSSSPLDIDAIQGGVPVKIKAGDTSTPLGNLRVPKSP